MHKLLSDKAFGFSDAWHFCGSPEPEQYTWDTTENTNLGAEFRSKMRFDRILFISPGVSDVLGAPGLDGLAKGAQASAASTRTPEVKSRARISPYISLNILFTIFLHIYIEICILYLYLYLYLWQPKQLLGKEKVPGLCRFPSDHWGLLTEWAYGAPVLPSPPCELD